MVSDADRPERKQMFKQPEPTEASQLRSSEAESTVAPPALASEFIEPQSPFTLGEKIGQV